MFDRPPYQLSSCHYTPVCPSLVGGKSRARRPAPIAITNPPSIAQRGIYSHLAASMGKRKENYKPHSKRARRKSYEKRAAEYLERTGQTLQQAAQKGRLEACKNRRELASAERCRESAQAKLDAERVRSRDLAAARDAVELKCAAQTEVAEAAQTSLDAAVTHVRQLEEDVGEEQRRRRRAEEELTAEEERREAAEKRMQEQAKMMRSEEAKVEDMKEQLAQLRTQHEQLEKQKARLESEFAARLQAARES